MILEDVDVGRYEVSNLGRVRTNDWYVPNRFCKRLVKGHVLNLHGDPYLQCYLSKKEYYVHRLVACMFIDNPDNKEEVNHIDGNTRNNSVENLEWVTKSENATHSYFSGLSPRSIPILCVEDNKYFPSILSAAKFYNLYSQDVLNRLYDEPQPLPYLKGKFNKHFVKCDRQSDSKSIVSLKEDGMVHISKKYISKGQTASVRIPCRCIELDKRFRSLSEAGRYFHRNESDVKRCIDNPCYTIEGYHMERLEGYK